MNLNNKLWTAWLMGFLDAEGHFQVFPKARVNVKGVTTNYGVGYHIHIGVGLRDLEWLEFIKLQFEGIGKIDPYPHKVEAHYAISRKGVVKWLMDHLLGQHALLTIHQSSRYNQLRSGMINNVTRFDSLQEFRAYFDSFVLATQPLTTNIPQELLDAWIVGFINGEGCFSHAEGQTSARFYIEHTHREVLLMIKERSGVEPNVNTRPSRDGRKVTCMLEFTTAIDLNKLIQFLDNGIPLQGYKLYQYNEWLHNMLKR